MSAASDRAARKVQSKRLHSPTVTHHGKASAPKSYVPASSPSKFKSIKPKSKSDKRPTLSFS